MKYPTKAIIFDFDGVILESFEAKTLAFKKMYLPFGKNIALNVVKHHLNNSGISRFAKFKYYHKEFLNINLDQNKLNILSTEFSNLVLKEVIKSPFVEGIKDFILKYQNKYKFFISSGTPLNELKFILKKKKIIDFFTNFYGSPKTKKEHIEEILNKNFYKNKQVLFIGDANIDYLSAKEFSIKFILRKHKHNKKISDNFDGIKINNFINFETYLK